MDFINLFIEAKILCKVTYPSGITQSVDSFPVLTEAKPVKQVLNVINRPYITLNCVFDCFFCPCKGCTAIKQHSAKLYFALSSEMCGGRAVHAHVWSTVSFAVVWASCTWPPTESSLYYSLWFLAAREVHYHSNSLWYQTKKTLLDMLLLQIKRLLSQHFHHHFMLTSKFLLKY